MTDHHAPTTAARDSRFVRAAARIGDLSSPFYREERQRDVWNEASAVGFQLMLVGMLAAATAMLWIGGEQALPYAATVLLLTGGASAVAVAYAAALGVRVDTGPRVLTPRMVPFLTLLVLLVVGLVRAAPTGSTDGSFWWGATAGAALGAVVAVLAAALADLRARRRDRD